MESYGTDPREAESVAMNQFWVSLKGASNHDRICSIRSPRSRISGYGGGITWLMYPASIFVQATAVWLAVVLAMFLQKGKACSTLVMTCRWSGSEEVALEVDTVEIDGYDSGVDRLRR
ncbi:hypothetical protein L2E82_30588 [Cichorium intybus]|uniref:Uncharacterized protein n=1 Tax=Cichorium intybus TaxID=13427 RepID=A0ACB9D118_CICIN|nr:hypothetical protein L2E82_30588 [Cichorium intybus]